MDIERPNSLGKTVEARSSSRPVKIAFLVECEESTQAHLVLDAIFTEAYTRWAGVFTLVIPMRKDGFAYPGYDSWLEFFDPDFVYSYVAVNDFLIGKIDWLCCPIALLAHSMNPQSDAAPTWRSYIPNLTSYIRPVRSISTIKSPQFHHFCRGEKNEISIATEYLFDSRNRFFADNFGSQFDLNNIWREAAGLFNTHCLVSPAVGHSITIGTERRDSALEMFSEISSRAVVPIVSFAMAHSEGIPKVEPYQWANVFKIFIGKGIFDRIHFWNSRHFTPAHSTTPGALILDVELFDDPAFVSQLGKYLDNNNYLGPSNGPRMVSLHSYSQNESTLSSISEKLKTKTYNLVSVSKNFNFAPIPTEEEIKNWRYRRAPLKMVYRLTEDATMLTAEEPAHFYYLTPQFITLGSGQWLVDLNIQRHNNLSKFSNVVDSWILPKRRQVVNAFTRRLGKVTNDGLLALIPSAERLPFINYGPEQLRSFEIYLPSDHTFFSFLVLGHFRYPLDDLRQSKNKKHFKEISISDKGQNLRGIVSMFDGLQQGYEILTNSYWRKVLRAGKVDSTKALVYDRKQLEGFLNNDLATKERIKKELNLENIGDAKKFIENNLTDNLEYLIRANVFFLIFHWRCKFCGHMNLRNFDNLKIRNNCEICQTESLAPIDLEWNYGLNEFVYRSLVTHTGLPVLWALGYLQDARGRNSFWYMPEVDLYEDDDDPKRKREIDALCVFEGKFFAVEAKLSAFLFINMDDWVGKFLEKITLLQPDTAILVFERYCDDENDRVHTKEKLAELASQIKIALSPDIIFELIIFEDFPEYKEQPSVLGIYGPRAR